VRLPLPEEVPKIKTIVTKRVLLVEDDPDQRELMVMALSKQDTEILGAKDGAEAIKFTSENQFDVCILDLNLPDTTGYELVERLLEIHGSNRPVTIALTGFGRPEDADRVKRAGFDYHFLKPADIIQLQRIINGTNADRWRVRSNFASNHLWNSKSHLRCRFTRNIPGCSLEVRPRVWIGARIDVGPR